MPRKARIDAPGALHHVIARGIDRRSIFEDDTDRDGDFVSAVLKQADEQLERKYDLRAKGCDFEAVVERVAELLEMESSQVLTNSKSRQAVRARSLVCFWASNELGINQIELAQRFRISQPAVSSACLPLTERGIPRPAHDPFHLSEGGPDFRPSVSSLARHRIFRSSAGCTPRPC